MEINIDENELYENIIQKINNIKDYFLKISDLSKTTNIDNHLEYLEKLQQFSLELNDIESKVEDVYEHYILQIPTELLTNEYKNKQKNIQINKNIQKIFLPVMLYYQIIMQNS
jgi:hypothetical protein